MDLNDVTFQKYTRQIKALIRISQSILVLKSPVEMACDLLRNMDSLGDFHISSIILFDDESRIKATIILTETDEQLVNRGVNLSSASIQDFFFRLEKEQVYKVSDKRTLQQPCPIEQIGFSGHVCSYLIVPILNNNNLIGTLNLGVPHEIAFLSEDIEIACGLANILGVGIQNSQLYEAMLCNVKEADTLRKTGLVVSATLEQEEAIDRILEQLSTVVPYDSASVQLRHKDELEVVGGRGYSNVTSMIGNRFPIMSDYPSEIIFETGKPLILDDAPSAYPFFRQEKYSNIHGWMGIPLIIQDRVIGMVTLNSKEPNHFTKDHTRLATTFATQVAVALENARLFREVHHFAITDSLTGLNNRRHFFKLAEIEFKRAYRYRRPLSILMMDLDHFKNINDTYGHTAGDEILHKVAMFCKETLRDVDILGRYGGEEFVALLPETNLVNAKRAAERVRRKVYENPSHIENEIIRISISIGLTGMTKKSKELQKLLDCADQALYLAKNGGRNQVVSYQEP